MQMLMPVQFDGWNWPDFFKSSFWSAMDALLNALQTGIRLFTSDSPGGGLSEAILSGLGACFQSVNFAGLYNRKDSMRKETIIHAASSTIFVVLADVLSSVAGIFLAKDAQKTGKDINNYAPTVAFGSGILGLAAMINMLCSGDNMTAKGARRTYTDIAAVALDLIAQATALIPEDRTVPILSWTALLLEVVVRICRYILTVFKFTCFTDSDTDQNDSDGGSDSSSGSSPISSSSGTAIPAAVEAV